MHQCIHCLMDGRKSIQPVKKRVMGCWHGYLSAARYKLGACGPADATANSSSLASAKYRMVCPSGTGVHGLSWKKRPLYESVRVFVHVHVYVAMLLAVDVCAS